MKTDSCNPALWKAILWVWIQPELCGGFQVIEFQAPEFDYLKNQMEVEEAERYLPSSATA